MSLKHRRNDMDPSQTNSSPAAATAALASSSNIKRQDKVHSPLPKGERRVRFADTMGMELVSIFLFDLISNYYFASIHSHKQLPPPPLSSTLHHQQQQQQQNQHHQQQQQSLLQQQQQRRKPFFPTTSSIITNTDLNNNQNNNNNNNNISTSNSTIIKTSTSNSITTTNNNSDLLIHNYTCEFTQPISLISFKERVKLNKVHLETCTVNSRAGNMSISCTIRVLNQSYDKAVIVRYTTDEWHTYTDSLASYKPHSNDGWSDKFTSTFSVTNQVKQFLTGQRIIFAVRYTMDGNKVHWDNNGGLNYAVKKI